MVRDLRSRVLGRTFSAVDTHWDRMVLHPSPEELRSRLIGRRIEALERHGKFAIFHLDRGGRLGLHRGMSGSLLHAPSGMAPSRHLRARFLLDDGSELRFDDPRKFGRLILAEEGESFEPPWERLGPDSLNGSIDAGMLQSLFAKRRAAVKTLLLNQRVLAGVGNIYADEALFLARIHPLRPAGGLRRPELNRLADAIHETLIQGIEGRGTTFSTYRDVEGKAGSNQHRLNVFGRAGEPCPLCGRPITKITLNGRGTHFCRHCQGRPR